MRVIGKYVVICGAAVLAICSTANAQDEHLKHLSVLIGEWQGHGTIGFDPIRAKWKFELADDGEAIDFSIYVGDINDPGDRMPLDKKYRVSWNNEKSQIQTHTLGQGNESLGTVATGEKTLKFVMERFEYRVAIKDDDEIKVTSHPGTLDITLKRK